MSWGLKLKRQNDFCFYNKVFSDFEIETIISNIDESQIQLGGLAVKGGINLNEEVRKTSIYWIPTTEINFWLYRKITDLINVANENWFNFDLLTLEDIQFSIYKVGDKYKKHLDHLPETAQNPRKLSFVVQLSNPEEYEGGSTLLHLGEKADVITKEKGSVTFFPSYVLHEVEPVTAGTRLALVGWVQGPPFK